MGQVPRIPGPQAALPDSGCLAAFGRVPAAPIHAVSCKCEQIATPPMKRSELNQIIRNAEEFIASFGFLLPPFANWSLEEWKEKQHFAWQLLEVGCGWDVTDFGRGEFERFGLVLVTLRNGLPNDKVGIGVPYAEKILVARSDQVTPMHYHKKKTEDIIVRGGSPLAVRLYKVRPDGTLDREDRVVVQMDGGRWEFPPGGLAIVEPGASITLEPGCAHAFWGHGGDCLVGEVSSVNDDKTDNYFLEETSRFPSIVEDEPPYRLMVSDYDTWLDSV